MRVQKCASNRIKVTAAESAAQVSTRSVCVIRTTVGQHDQQTQSVARVSRR